MQEFIKISVDWLMSSGVGKTPGLLGLQAIFKPRKFMREYMCSRNKNKIFIIFKTESGKVILTELAVLEQYSLCTKQVYS